MMQTTWPESSALSCGINIKPQKNLFSEIHLEFNQPLKTLKKPCSSFSENRNHPPHPAKNAHVWMWPWDTKSDQVNTDSICAN